MHKTISLIALATIFHGDCTASDVHTTMDDYIPKIIGRFDYLPKMKIDPNDIVEETKTLPVLKASKEDVKPKITIKYLDIEEPKTIVVIKQEKLEGTNLIISEGKKFTDEVGVDGLTDRQRAFRFAFGDDEDEVDEITDVSIPAYLDNSYYDELDVKIESSDGNMNIIVDKYLFDELFEKSLNKEKYQEYLDNQKTLEDEVYAEDVVCCGLKYEFDESNQRILLSLDVEAKKTNVVNFRRKEFVVDERIKISPSSLSGSISLYANQPFSNTEKDSDIKSKRLSLDVPMYINKDGYILENSFNAYSKNSLLEDTNSEEEESTSFARGYTTVSKVIEDKNILLSLGDINSQTSSYARGTKLLGFSLQKEKKKYNFTRRDTLRVAQRTLFLENDSIVEIFINDKRRKRLKLNAGTHELVDFTMDAGTNAVKIKITDIYGKVDYINYNDYFYGEILKAGEDRYGISVGKLAYKEKGANEYDYGVSFASATYTRGLEHFTFDTSLQLSDISYSSYGAKVIFPTTAGIISYSRNMTNYESITNKVRESIGYRATYKAFSINSYLNKIDNGYSSFGKDVTIQTKSEAFKLGLGYTKRGTKFAMSYSEIDNNITSLQKRELSYTNKINRELLLSASIGKDTYLSGGHSNEYGLISFSYTPVDSNTRVELYKKKKYDFFDQKGTSTDKATIRIDHADDEVQYNYVANHEMEDGFETNAGNVSRAGTYNKIDIDYSEDSTSIYKKKEGSFRFETGLVFAGGIYAVSKPQKSSFIIVENKIYDKDIKNMQVEGFESKERKSAHYIPDFTKRRAYIDESFLPIMYEAKRKKFDIVSSYKSGIYIPLELKRTVYVRAYLKDEDGEAYENQKVNIFDMETKEKFSAFTSESGQLVFSDALWGKKYLVKSKYYEYQIELPEHPESKKQRAFKISSLNPTKVYNEE